MITKLNHEHISTLTIEITDIFSTHKGRTDQVTVKPIQYIQYTIKLTLEIMPINKIQVRIKKITNLVSFYHNVNVVDFAFTLFNTLSIDFINWILKK